ncbi:hypothetical protein MLD38_028315 [Melastoma candidum]|uniref:Uncharacterized protein n=1 Tax=Melastoma candidum TaxID=119954 RepID=A0ACB9N1I9_9MYRT|nr:hypothetical protein MLD38_028315 [Melastoma candidum]
MKNFLKKLHVVPNKSEEAGELSSSNRVGKPEEVSSNVRILQSRSGDNKPLAGISSWLHSVTHRHSSGVSPPLSSSREEVMEQLNPVSLSNDVDIVRSNDDNNTCKNTITREPDPVDNSKGNDPEIEEEYQIQLAMELSAREDPEAVQIEAVKQISLGSCDPDSTPAEVVAYRYWIYNALGYNDKILDGFYDLYGVLTDSPLGRMPSLVNLQGTPLTGNITWEAVLVNRAADSNLLKLEQKALEIAVESKASALRYGQKRLVQSLSKLVSDYMGGPVVDPDSMLRAWQSLDYSLKSTLGSMVLPLGSLTIGMARHRALLFKVLADSIGIQCRLVKGREYTGSEDVAMNFVKLEDGREYIVDLMADPGTLIPADAAISHTASDEPIFSSSPFSRDMDSSSSHVASSSSTVTSSLEEQSELGTSDQKSRSKAIVTSGLENVQSREIPGWPNYSYAHARSPSWTEGVSSPAVQRMKVKDVSQYMIDAAKDNPQLAQKLHNVLVESGVAAPPNLFSEIYPRQLDSNSVDDDHVNSKCKDDSAKGFAIPDSPIVPRFLPPLPPPQRPQSKAILTSNQPEQVKPMEGFVFNHPECILPQNNASPPKLPAKVPVAAAAAAAAAAVASSMVVAATKSTTESNLELPVAAAATATAAAVVATTAAVSKQLECGARSDVDSDSCCREPQGSGNRGRDSDTQGEDGGRISDKSTGNDSSKSDTVLDSVADCEIMWDEINLGERIGLGSYGEVYRGDWHGTEVAVKRFLEQDISGESLEEFISEVRIMKKLRHPNVVLFMGAVTRPPNLSIVTEFLPRGSLYRLIHRPNNQLDGRRRLRMALDTARGMNYLHNCNPVIVHRDLKTPNLLVDKNWVVKVCDFGLSRMKHSTFLSSRSTAGTAEWMAPEVLRNEPCNEKSDVYSFGVILWELATLQQPWGGMNPMQVVGAVGFQHRRLDIPGDMDPAVAEIIEKCWQTDPNLRPTFAEIMNALKLLQKPITGPRATG